MDYKYILLQKDGNVATLTFNRPERLNTISFDVMVEISAALQEANDDEEVRVLVLTGAGRAFCAGGNFKGATGERTPASLATQGHIDSIRLAEELFKEIMSATGRLHEMRIPTIAMVNGVAAGAGFSLAQACDLRVGSDRARFMVAWTRRGHVPVFGDTWMLPRIIGVAKAADLIFTARIVEAQEAFDMGLLNRLVPHERLVEETMGLADQITKGPPLALRLSKYNLYDGLSTNFATAVRLLTLGQSHTFLTEDWHESTKAFQEKREPVFKGK